MSFRLRKHLVAAAVLATGGVALAHHIALPLSHADAPEISSHIVLYKRPANVGVPGYVASATEHEHMVALTDGASFQVVVDGTAETVVFHAADFPDVGHATDAQVVAAVNPQLTASQLESQNGYFLFHALQGGSSHSIRLVEGVGRPLQAMGFSETQQFGSERVQMVLSAHGDEHDGVPGELAHHPYLLFASAGEGSFSFRGVEVPIARDAVTAAFVQAARSGALPSFFSHLNGTEDARATVTLDQLGQILGLQFPSDLHFAYVVLSMDGTSVEFVSNRFSVHVEQ